MSIFFFSALVNSCEMLKANMKPPIQVTVSSTQPVGFSTFLKLKLNRNRFVTDI